MVHHQEDILLSQVIKAYPFGEDMPDQFMVDFTGTFLVRTACITVKNICPVQRCSIPVFDLSGIGKFTPVVSQDHREQPVKILCAKDCVKRIKYPDD